MKQKKHVKLPTNLLKGRHNKSAKHNKPSRLYHRWTHDGCTIVGATTLTHLLVIGNSLFQYSLQLVELLCSRHQLGQQPQLQKLACTFANVVVLHGEVNERSTPASSGGMAAEASG